MFFSTVHRIRFGTGNVQIGVGFQKTTGRHVLGFKYIEEAFHPVPIDTSKSMEEQGFCYFLEFSTVDAVDKVIDALCNIRADMKAKEEEIKENE